MFDLSRTFENFSFFVRFRSLKSLFPGPFTCPTRRSPYVIVKPGPIAGRTRAQFPTVDILSVMIYSFLFSTLPGHLSHSTRIFRTLEPYANKRDKVALCDNCSSLLPASPISRHTLGIRLRRSITLYFLLFS